MHDKKQIVIATLRALTTDRFVQMCRLKRLRRDALDTTGAQEQQCRSNLACIDAKMRWELSKHSELLNKQ